MIDEKEKQAILENLAETATPILSKLQMGLDAYINQFFKSIYEAGFEVVRLELRQITTEHEGDIPFMYTSFIVQHRKTGIQFASQPEHIQGKATTGAH